MKSYLKFPCLIEEDCSKCEHCYIGIEDYLFCTAAKYKEYDEKRGYSYKPGPDCPYILIDKLSESWDKSEQKILDLYRELNASNS